MFWLLGIHRGPDITIPAVASLAGCDPAEARRPPAEPARAHLTAEHRLGRYTFHDLLRSYAAEQARGALWGSITGSCLGGLVGWDHRLVTISAFYLLVRCLLGCLTVLTRNQVSKDAELLVLRHENAVCAARSAGSATSQPAGCGSRRCRDWFPAASGVRCSR